MAPPAPIMAPAAFTSSLAPASSEPLEAAGSGAFEADGWAEQPDFFFLGAMVNSVVEDEDGDEDDALRMLSGSRKRSPYLAQQRCRGISAATYGTGRPLVGSARGSRVAQRADQCTIARQRAHKKFTQVRAAARRKTLLLLWWIDGGKDGGERSTLARQGLPWGSSDYARMGV